MGNRIPAAMTVLPIRRHFLWVSVTPTLDMKKMHNPDYSIPWLLIGVAWRAVTLEK